MNILSAEPSGKVWSRGPHISPSAIIFGKFQYMYIFFCFLGMWGKNTHLGGGNFKYLLFSPQNLGEMIQFNSNPCHSTRAIQQRSISSPGMMCLVTICTSQLMIVNGLLHLLWWATVPRQQFLRGRGVVEVKDPGFPKRTPEDSVVLKGLEVVLLELLDMLLVEILVGVYVLLPNFRGTKMRTSNGLEFPSWSWELALPKTNGWNLQIPPKGQGETSTQNWWFVPC